MWFDMMLICPGADESNKNSLVSDTAQVLIEQILITKSFGEFLQTKLFLLCNELETAIMVIKLPNIFFFFFKVF